MKNKINIYYVFITFFFLASSVYAQNNKIVSFKFENLTLKEILVKIEEDTNFAIYYHNNWLDESKITKSYKQTDIKTVLKDLLKDTSLNFSIYQHQIVLTKNTIIQTKLPINYFTEKKDYEKDKNKPIILKDYVSNSNNYQKNITTIGKFNANNNQNEYTLKGYVKSVSSKKGLSNVIVSIPEINKITYTNGIGHYTLKLPTGFSTLEVKLPGYEKTQKNIVLYGDGTLDFEMEDEIISLGEIIIVSNKDENVKKPKTGLIKIDVKGIKTIPSVLGERDVLKVATLMPGVKTTGEGSLGYNIRGGKIDQNLILLDHALLFNTSHFFGFFSAINPFSISNVDIYKGSIPAEYGGRLSSVIDISSKKINTQKFSGEGNIGPITGNLMLEVPLRKDKTAVLLGLRHTYSDWVLKKIPRESLKKSEASFSDGIFRFESKINDKNLIKTTAYYSNDQFKISFDSLYKYSNKLASFEWSHKYNNKTKSSLQFSNSNYKFGITYEGNTNQNFDLSYSINETSFKNKYTHNINNKHIVNYGVSSKLYYIEPGNLKPLDSQSSIQSKLIPKEKALESALFFSDAIKLNDKLLIDIGFRYSYYSALGKGVQKIYDSNYPMSEESIIESKTYAENEIMKSYATPEIRLSSRFSILSNLSIKTSYNKTAQYIHRLSSNTTASPIDTWKLSDLNIKPLKSDQYSIGIYQNIKENSYEISLEGYYKKMKNILDYRVGAELLLNENIETNVLSGTGKAYGIEFLLRKKYGKFNGWLSYSYSKALLQLKSDFVTNQVNNGNYFAANYDKPHDVSLIMNFKLTRRYSFSSNFVYQTGRPITYPIGRYEFAGIEHVLYSDRNKYRIPDYYRLDLGINIEGNHKIKKLAHSFWNISVYNVLGRNNPYSIFFVNKDGRIKAYKTSIFAIPIPTLTYNFKF